ncbi:CPP1-like family protein [Plectonema cf. radiosum LEGE 06105]|uniref:CPP1-like family protein n=1 Tax=Plectonema cf. radiosum LEGE 06105 TaxID=945769 RepID=A0A8J7EZD1_9CYAN|nr:CPP1-like family protein [Plectonema radiosum]MBE9211652.1 CPP1-like family protein [Plectonema cf. radiosum LEGE 06105]
MSDQNPYEKLGVSEDASFEEIQDTRNRLVEQYSGDTSRIEIIEAAYDAVLMNRLRMRQEGKIKVPERIRFPESKVQVTPDLSPVPKKQSPPWLQRMVDKPSTLDIVVPGIWYLGLSANSLFYRTGGDQVLQLMLVIGVGVSIYFLNRKENKFGRAVLFTLVGLIVGLIIGGLIASSLTELLNSANFTTNQFATVVTFILLWLICSFLK